MAFSKESFVDGYIAEVKENIDSINSLFVALKNDSSNKSVLKEILRKLHTIKGASRMLDFVQVEQLSHNLEDVFKSLDESKIEFSTNILKLSFKITEIIEECLACITEGTEHGSIAIWLDLCQKAAVGFFFDIDEIQNEMETSASVTSEISTDEENVESFDNISSVRIEISRINGIIESYDNLIMKQFRLKHQIELLEKKLQNRDAERIYEVPRLLKEELISAENSIFDTQRDLFALRMLPLEIILDPLRKQIEKESIKSSKQVKVDIPHTTFMLDKVILEQLKNILLHLVRNSLDHGIETPEVRSALGKNATGTISIHETQISNRIVITVSDDGAGINYAKIRERAASLYMNMHSEIETLQDSDLQQFLFMPGFSTASKASETSGRGMGLDIVRSSMEKIKGKIKIETKKNEGTSFELTIPLSLASQRGLFVVTGNTKVMIPSHYISEIITSTEDKIVNMQNRLFINTKSRNIPLYYLSSILEIDRQSKINCVIIVEYLETRMAIVVDSIQQNENVIINPLPRCLKNLSSMQGVVYDENYAIIPILDIPTIMQKMRELVFYDTKKNQARTTKSQKHILVVDDSSTTRQIEQAIFQADGYIVDTASDGIEALEKLRNKNIDAIITDINMPRMDGMILLSNIRRNPRYEHIPVIIVSGAYDKYAKKQFMEAGAQAYIVKSDFQRGNLLDTVKELLND